MEISTAMMDQLHGSPRLRTLSVAMMALLLTHVSLGEPPSERDDPWGTLDPLVRAVNRGVGLMEQYRYAEAVGAFEQVVALAPKSVESRVNLALAVFNRSGQNDLKRAEELLDKVLAEQPDHVRALYFRGIIHQYSGQDTPALTCFERVLKEHPRDASTWYLLSRSKAHLGQPYRADLERAVQENPALASAYYDLMRLAWQEGREEDAKAYQATFQKLREHPLCEMIVLPHYRQMGPLAMVEPLTRSPQPRAVGAEVRFGPARTLFASPAGGSWTGVTEETTGLAGMLARDGVQVVTADINGDGRLDLITNAVTRDGHRGVQLMIRQPDSRLTDATGASGLAKATDAISLATGDYDNDGHVDLYVSRSGPNQLWRSGGDGTFADVTETTGTAGGDAITVSSVFLDADHDGDLDLYVLNTSTVSGDAPSANQLFNNNADGTFTNIAATAGVACAAKRSVMLAPADLDGDRDTDLIVFHCGAPASVFLNDRFGKYHAGEITDEPIRGEMGGVAQDFNGDCVVDLLVSSAGTVPACLFLSDGTAMRRRSAQFDGCVAALSSWGDVGTPRVVDIDLDGDLDIAFPGSAGHVLFNDGTGRFVAQPGCIKVPVSDTEDKMLASELIEFTGDGVVDLVRIVDGKLGRIELHPGTLTPPSSWLAITPTGDRGEDKRTRSPASGFGAKIEVRCGVHQQSIIHTGLSGGLSQSLQPIVFGLDGVAKASYVSLTWPDGVTQCENELAGRQHHRIREMERRVSSCPVLFAWNGHHFAFISDFAGVGGLGYLVAEGDYASPQPLEHVKIEPEQLRTKDGRYELRIAEPMEEVAYIDRLELVAIDHTADVMVWPDERLVITGPPASHDLLVVSEHVDPVAAIGPNGEDCVERVRHTDRTYAYQPKLDRRFYGFCRPHALELRFDVPDRWIEGDADQSIYLFVGGWIEYPYSQTTFAASQAGVAWEPLRVDQLSPDGQWETIIPDAGAPGGMGRTIAIDVTGKLRSTDVRLRLTTNLEIYFDRIFVGTDTGTGDLTVQTVPLVSADLRRLGFPLEFSPDGRHPLIYSYDIIEPTSSFKMPRGVYTRYGPVESLLATFDDAYVILGTGDEMAVSFDAAAITPVAPGSVRSFVLISHAYCKDMDLYTGAPDTVEPLPHKSMAAYPYGPPRGEESPPPVRIQRNGIHTRMVE